jgi:phosphohistidine swiveling domain-containing protein
MNEAQIKKKILKYHWEPWLKRPFFGFIMSTFCGGNTKRAFKKIGLPDWECNFLLSDAEWYSSDSSYASAKPVILKWFKTHSVLEISQRLEKSHDEWAIKIKQMARHPQIDTTKKLRRLDAILREITTYVWAVHAAEHFFTPLLKNRADKVIEGDVEKFIGDGAFPSKSNAAEQMVEEYKNGISPKILTKKFGWMRARDGFVRPYNTNEITEIAKHALALPKHKHPIIPKSLEKMFAEARELVYLRMLRMDCYFELMFLTRPILKATAKKLKVPYPKLKYYTIDSLIKSRPKYYPPNFTCAAIKGKCYYFNEPLFGETSSGNITELKGNVAQTGLVKGTVKIVMSVKDLNKVKKGDILVTYMTSPNFLTAMKLAAAFVTNEGGLTCHAAIVAREMGKPCIIGTKIATKVFKDGDMVEMDANKGIVRKLK